MAPSPWSWHTVKDDENTIYDFAVVARHEVDDKPMQFKPVHSNERAFCWVDGSEAIFRREIGRQINVHTQRDRALGRAAEPKGEQSRGAVFQYDALAAGEELAGIILTETMDDATLLARLLATVTELGGSHNSGYGRIEIITGPVATGDAWREVPGNAANIAAGTSFVVMFLSDAIVREHETGQYALDVADELGRCLDAKLSPIAPPREDDEHEQRGVRRMSAVGGFNRTWGLPLPQAQAIARRQCLCFRRRS